MRQLVHHKAAREGGLVDGEIAYVAEFHSEMILWFVWSEFIAQVMLQVLFSSALR